MNEQNVLANRVRCTVCLSVGWHLNPVGKYAEILRTLLTNAELAITMDDISSIQICWECRASLHKASAFRKRVCYAQQLLRLANLHRTMNLPTSLSPLKVSHKQNHDYEFTHTDKEIDDESIKSECESPMDSDEDPFEDINSEEALQEYINSEDAPQECIDSEKAPRDYIKLEKVQDFSEEPQEDIELDRMENDEAQDTFDEQDVIRKMKIKQCSVALERCDVEREKASLKREPNEHSPAVKLEPRSPERAVLHTALEQTKRTTKKSHICNTCKRSFFWLSARNRHMRIHTGEKPFSCTACDEKFSRAYSLKTHKLVHTGEKPFSCTTCGANFVRASSLKTHMRVHTGEKPFGCDQCDAKFSHLSNLYKHIRMHSGEKPFSCTICDKKFTQKHHLNRHIRIHTGEKPFSCTICDMKFMRKSHLNRHMRVHTGKKPFSCTMCDKKFTQKTCLKAHMLKHSGLVPST